MSSLVTQQFDLEDALWIDWFEGDFGELDEITLSNKIVKGRKTHRCHNCDGEIAKGEHHRSMTQRSGGELESFRWCQNCCIAGILHDKGHYAG